MLLVAAVDVLLADAGLALEVEDFAPLAVLAGLLLCAEQKPAMPRNNAAMAATDNLFVIISVCFPLRLVALRALCAA